MTKSTYLSPGPNSGTSVLDSLRDRTVFRSSIWTGVACRDECNGGTGPQIFGGAAADTVDAPTYVERRMFQWTCRLVGLSSSPTPTSAAAASILISASCVVSAIICDRCPSQRLYPHQRRRFAARAWKRHRTWRPCYWSLKINLTSRSLLCRHSIPVWWRTRGHEHLFRSRRFNHAHPARRPHALYDQPALRAFRGRPLINPSPATRIDLQFRSVHSLRLGQDATASSETLLSS